MRRFLVLPLLITLVFAACTDDAPPVSTEGRTVLADAHFYPVLPGSSWIYRVDTSGTNGMDRGVGTVLSRISGTFESDSLTYVVQVNRVTIGGVTELDSLYIRHATDGVRISSPGLQTLSSLPEIPNFPIDQIPNEFLAVPAAGAFQATWEIVNIEINIIPIFPIYYRVKGSYRGLEDVTTDLGVFHDCAHVTLILEARLPNLANPTVPLLIDEEAEFWFSRPQGLVAADGSDAIFSLLRGTIPLETSFGRTRQEVTDMEITQPDPFCLQ